jgi:hypothetical protein
MAQVFVSYSRIDLSFVERLVEDLNKSGHEVWYDLSGLEGGSRWGTEIQEAIKDSKYVITILSPESVKSEWVEREFLYASKLKLKIVPLFYRECDLPLNFMNLNYIDVQGRNYELNFAKILGALYLSKNNLNTCDKLVLKIQRDKQYGEEKTNASYL